MAENASAEIRMGDVAGSEMTTKDGKKQFQGSGGNADTYKDPPRVTINRHYLESDAEYRRVAMAGTLAHELFGHAFEAQRARKTGLPRSVQYYYRGDEIGSQLVDWLVQTELKGEVLDGDPDSYLADPEKYYKSLWPMDAYYAVTLSPKEMADPVAALRPRLKYVRADRVKTTADRKQMKEWNAIRDHFIKVHGLAAARFAPVDERLRTFELYAADRLKELDEIEKHLGETIASWAAKGSKEPPELRAGARSSYVRDADARVTARTKALLKLRAEKRGPASVSPDGVLEMPPLVIRGAADPANEPIDLDMLGVLYEEDREKNPGHWKK